MEIHNVTDSFAVGPQMQPEDMREIADRGFVAVICNRPDGEVEGQPSIDKMREAAQAAGLAYHHIPVQGGQFPEPAITAFRAVRRGSDGPILAHCRTGRRSITLDTLANPEGLEPSERLTRAKAAGYDLAAIRDKLD